MLRPDGRKCGLFRGEKSKNFFARFFFEIDWGEFNFHLSYFSLLSSLSLRPHTVDDDAIYRDGSLSLSSKEKLMEHLEMMDFLITSFTLKYERRDKGNLKGEHSP